MVDGEFNEYLLEPEDNVQDEDTTMDLSTAGLEDMGTHLLPQSKSWERYRQTWSMLRRGREVRSCIYYLMGTDLHLLQKVSVRDNLHNTDHYLVMGCLCRSSAT